MRVVYFLPDTDLLQRRVDARGLHQAVEAHPHEHRAQHLLDDLGHDVTEKDDQQSGQNPWNQCRKRLEQIGDQVEAHGLEIEIASHRYSSSFWWGPSTA